jgi:hypothetical protein
MLIHHCVCLRHFRRPCDLLKEAKIDQLLQDEGADDYVCASRGSLGTKIVAWPSQNSGTRETVVGLSKSSFGSNGAFVADSVKVANWRISPVRNLRIVVVSAQWSTAVARIPAPKKIKIRKKSMHEPDAGFLPAEAGRISKPPVLARACARTREPKNLY